MGTRMGHLHCKRTIQQRGAQSISEQRQGNQKPSQNYDSQGTPRIQQAQKATRVNVRWRNADVREAYATRLGVLWVLQLPVREAGAQHLAVLRAANVIAQIICAIRCRCVARWNTAPVLHCDAGLVHIRPLRHALKRGRAANVEAVRVNAVSCGIRCTKFAQRAQIKTECDSRRDRRLVNALVLLVAGREVTSSSARQACSRA